MKTYGVIMAGGGGTRFWPMSRQLTPKQLLNLSGRDLMINETIDRIAQIVDNKDIFIVTNVTQGPGMKLAVDGRVADDHILLEPAARNTAACIGYAAMEIIKKYGDGVMCVFPADHCIQNLKKFGEVFKLAAEVADKENKLVTVGITPTFPSTGYGYIRYDKDMSSKVLPVKEFVEKPNYETAVSYLDAGCYAWNSGMFVWKASVILEKFKELLPDIYGCIEKIGAAMGTEQEQAVIDEIYPVIPKISVDYGIMERADNVVVIPAEMGWDDVGSWETLGVLYDKDEQGNILRGEQVNIDTKDCISYAKNGLIATIGVENLIIVQTEDAVLVCSKDRAQDVKQVVDILKEQGKKEYL